MPTKRVRYFTGQRLGPEEFRAEQDYHRQTRRRLVRALFGWGVVSGLRVSREAGGAGRVVVGPGAAVDASGELLCVGPEERLVLPASGTRLHVVLEYAEEPCDPAPRRGDEPDAPVEFTRTLETFRISLQAEPARDALVLARLVRRTSGWQLDRTFRRRGLARQRRS